ncbi:MAG: hypothetical protein JRD05_11535 [Deltaproteobacteria bacterium]|nr:hypothetical protein [Deltaproteobacteria bacterium]
MRDLKPQATRLRLRLRRARERSSSHEVALIKRSAHQAKRSILPFANCIW